MGAAGKGSLPAAPRAPPRAGAPSSFGDRILAWRDAMLSNPRFQRAASRFPLTRPFARRSATRLFDLTAGFVYAQILYALVEADVLGFVAASPRSLEAMARQTNLPADGARRLVLAAAALDLLQIRSDGRYGLGPLGAALVGNSGVQAMIRHHRLAYADLADPLALLRGEGPPTQLSRFWAYSGSDEASARRYSALMAESQDFVAEDVLDRVPMRGARRLLDVGGGEGVFLAAAARRWPHLELALFDLPPVAERAQARLAQAGVAAQVSAGNMLTDELPAGADFVSLVRVVHDHDDGPALALLERVRRCLGSGGRLLIAEPFAAMRGAERVGHPYFGLYLAAMGSGRPRTADELTALVKQAGFASARTTLTRGALPLGILVASLS
jgi:demethylspheroidene O-methyltransferase